ncbi:hypothetical protein LguiA_016233 [Lonicera macranthoides]
MSLTLDLIPLRTLLSSLQSSSSSSSSSSNTTTAFTIFCPLDEAFYSSKYPQPPLTLLQYHISPLKLERQTLQSYHVGSKIDTLLPGHPLVISTLHKKTGQVSINDVKITDWEIYNDGRIILHGVENFFDPAFQTLLYPQYDRQDNDIRSVTDERTTL